MSDGAGCQMERRVGGEGGDIGDSTPSEFANNATFWRCSACHGWCQCAPILVQTATGHEVLETYGNSIPITHSVFHNSVENQATENAARGLIFATFRQDAVEISVEVQEKITGLLRGLAENSAYTFHVSQANVLKGSANKIPLTSVLK